MTPETHKTHKTHHAHIRFIRLHIHKHISCTHRHCSAPNLLSDFSWPYRYIIYTSNTTPFDPFAICRCRHAPLSILMNLYMLIRQASAETPFTRAEDKSLLQERACPKHFKWHVSGLVPRILKGLSQERVCPKHGLALVYLFIYI